MLRSFIDFDLQVGMMAGEAGKLSNQARFILEKCDGTLKVKRESAHFNLELVEHRLRTRRSS